MRKKQNGVCRLCHIETELTFEHIPPRSAFNKKTRYQSVPFLDAMKMEDPLNGKPKGKLNQGGVGFHSYCEKCNNFLGLEYVNAYKDWAQLGAYLLSKPEATSCHFKAEKMLPNEILKQIISMFIAINEPWYGEAHPELLDFVKNPDSIELHEKYRIFAYLKRPGQIRYLPFLVQGSFSQRKPVTLSEIAYKPFGYIMTYGDNSERSSMVDITCFKNAKPKKETVIEMNINIFDTHIPLPMDYRSAEEIEKALKNNS